MPGDPGWDPLGISIFQSADFMIFLGNYSYYKNSYLVKAHGKAEYHEDNGPGKGGNFPKGRI